MHSHGETHHDSCLEEIHSATTRTHGQPFFRAEKQQKEKENARFREIN